MIKKSLLLLIVMSCLVSAQEVEKASFYEDLFHRDSGWTGADGTYSYALDDKTTLWSFSDTFFGPVIDGAHRDFRFVNNSHVLQTGSELNFLKAPGFVPPDRSGWFWMWDGRLSKERFSVLLGQFEVDPEGGSLGFQQSGLWYAEADLKSEGWRTVSYRKLPFFGKRPGEAITFGTTITDHGPWTYIGGVHDRGLERRAVLARVPLGRLQEPGMWRFFDGKGWTDDMWRSAELFARASMEASIYATQDGGFCYIGSLDTQGEVVARYAPSITGPWSEPVTIYDPPEAVAEVYAYNAKAHRHLTDDGRVLISYNVNTLDLDEVIENADIYRPRFIWWTPPEPGWLPISEI